MLVLVVGCSSPPAGETPASSGGMGMGGSAGAEPGVVAASRNASMQVAESGAAADGLRVDRVLAPDDGWVVVRSTLPPGGVLGFAAVVRGENRNVKVALTGADSVQVRVALHVDRGRRGDFEFEPEAQDRSLDRPVIASGSPVESSVRLADWGVGTRAYTAVLMVDDQRVGRPAVEVAYALLPAPGWISVQVVERGVPGRRVGLLARGPGEWHGVSVPLDERVSAGPLVVTIHADRGTPAQFDYDPRHPYVSADQPFVSSTLVVSKRIRVR